MTKIFLLHLTIGIAVLAATAMTPWGEAKAAVMTPLAHHPSPVDGVVLPSPIIETICACHIAFPGALERVVGQA